MDAKEGISPFLGCQLTVPGITTQRQRPSIMQPADWDGGSLFSVNGSCGPSESESRVLTPQSLAIRPVSQLLRLWGVAAAISPCRLPEANTLGLHTFYKEVKKSKLMTYGVSSHEITNPDPLPSIFYL